jgi:hypothetical protein
MNTARARAAFRRGRPGALTTKGEIREHLSCPLGLNSLAKDGRAVLADGPKGRSEEGAPAEESKCSQTALCLEQVVRAAEEFRLLEASAAPEE